MKMYFVGTIRDIDIEGTHGTRVVGYYENLEAAKQCIEENHGDIHEHGYYKYAVIEDVEPGLYQSSDHPIFFKWSGDIKTGKYVEISKPKELDHFIGFTIG